MAAGTAGHAPQPRHPGEARPCSESAFPPNPQGKGRGAPCGTATAGTPSEARSAGPGGCRSPPRGPGAPPGGVLAGGLGDPDADPLDLRPCRAPRARPSRGPALHRRLRCCSPPCPGRPNTGPRSPPDWDPESPLWEPASPASADNRMKPKLKPPRRRHVSASANHCSRGYGGPRGQKSAAWPARKSARKSPSLDSPAGRSGRRVRRTAPVLCLLARSDTLHPHPKNP